MEQWTDKRIGNFCGNLKILNVKKLIHYTILKKKRNKFSLQEAQKHGFGTRFSKGTRYLIPKTTNKYGERVYKAKIPRLSNNIPSEIREIQSVTSMSMEVLASCKKSTSR